MMSDILHEMTQINHLLLEHLLKTAQANKAADIIPVENDVQCPQSTHSLGPGTFSNLVGSGAVLNICTAYLFLMLTRHKNFQSKTNRDTNSRFSYCDIKTVISCN